MGGEENAKPVNIDPQCIQEALRMYFQPTKNDDPQLGFYTMYKRETVEYDTEYMRKHNEDLNTTLVFAGIFSAVNSAFIIDVQSKLEPDSGDRSEAYLRAILLSLNGSISPDEDPAAPPAWSGPPQEIITTSDLLYASLLMSLLAAFVAMLGKQWLNRYLRHTGGSMVERCGDRQRKFDGLKRWPFRLFIESLPIILQIALLLLASGLSRYMWSVNVSVARVVISFTVFGFLFYVGVVVAGTSSYECPFQTPVSIALRYLWGSETARKWLSSLSPLNVISRRLLYWKFSVSSILSGIRRMVRNINIGHQIIILLLQIDRAFGNAKQRMGQGIRGFGRTGLLPIAISTRGGHRQPSAPHDSPGLRVHVRNLEGIRRQNEDNVRCVCWVLRNITDPEAIDYAVRLAGAIRWFDGDPDHNPPFDLVVSTFETCFDLTGQLYPGMRDRAYFSARAILQINMRARVLSHGHAPEYLIPPISADPSQHNDPDFFHLIQMLKRNLNASRPTLLLPDGAKNTQTHSRWLLNSFVDLTRVGPNPILQSYESYLTIASTNHQDMIANILLMWCLFLGGNVEEETIWAIDKSDSLETILSLLSTKVLDAISGGSCVQHLEYLLNFLAAWEERPAYLTSFAYQWCSAFSEVITGPGHNWTYSRPAHSFWTLSREIGNTLGGLEKRFTEVGPGCELVNHAHDRQRDLDLDNCMALLLKTLEIGFRLAQPGRGRLAINPDLTSYHDWMFEVAFSSDDDEVIADAVCALIADSDRAPGGSFVRRSSTFIERTTPLSPRLRQAAIRAICCIRPSEPIELPLETALLLNHLEADVDDVEEKGIWVKLLVEVIRSECWILSSHCWRLLDKLTSTAGFFGNHVVRDTEVMRALEDAKDWEKLEVWMGIVWMSLQSSEDVEIPELEEIEQATLRLCVRRLSALQRFEHLCESDAVSEQYKPRLQGKCDNARTERLPLDSPPPPQPVHAQPQTLPLLLGDDTF